MNPVDFEAWANAQITQANGFAIYFVMIAALSILYILLSRRHEPESNPRVVARMILTFGFVGLLFIADRTQTATIFFVLLMLYIFGRAWLPHLTPRMDIILIGTLAALIRLPLINAPLWYDETFTAGIARLNLADAMQVIRADVHPPGFYLLEMLAVKLFGESAISLRLSAYIPSTLSALGIYRLVLALKMPIKTARLAAIFAAILPGYLYFATEARAYSLLTFIAIIAIIAVIEKRPILYALCAAILPMLHVYGYLYTAIIGLCAIALHRNGNAKIWMFTNIPAAMIGLLWLPSLLGQTGDIANGFWIAWTLPASLWPITVNTIGATLENPLYILAAAGLAIGLTVIGFYVFRHKIKTPEGAIITAVIILPPLIAIGASLLWNPIYLARALLPSTTLLIIIWSYAITHAPAADRLTAHLILWPVLFILVIGYFQNEGKKPIGDHVRQGCKATDIIFTSSTAVHFLVTYETPNHDLYIWTGANDLNQTLPSNAKDALGWNQVSTPPPGLICYVAFDTALSSINEMNYRADLLAEYPPFFTEVYDETDLSKMTIYRFEVTP